MHVQGLHLRCGCLHTCFISDNLADLASVARAPERRAGTAPPVAYVATRGRLSPPTPQPGDFFFVGDRGVKLLRDRVLRCTSSTHRGRCEHVSAMQAAWGRDIASLRAAETPEDEGIGDVVDDCTGSSSSSGSSEDSDGEVENMGPTLHPRVPYPRSPRVTAASWRWHAAHGPRVMQAEGPSEDAGALPMVEFLQLVPSLPASGCCSCPARARYGAPELECSSATVYGHELVWRASVLRYCSPCSHRSCDTVYSGYSECLLRGSSKSYYTYRLHYEYLDLFVVGGMSLATYAQFRHGRARVHVPQEALCPTFCSLTTFRRATYAFLTTIDMPFSFTCPKCLDSLRVIVADGTAITILLRLFSGVPATQLDDVQTGPPGTSGCAGAGPFGSCTSLAGPVRGGGSAPGPAAAMAQPHGSGSAGGGGGSSSSSGSNSGGRSAMPRRTHTAVDMCFCVVEAGRTALFHIASSILGGGVDIYGSKVRAGDLVDLDPSKLHATLGKLGGDCHSACGTFLSIVVLAAYLLRSDARLSPEAKGSGDVETLAQFVGCLASASVVSSYVPYPLVGSVLRAWLESVGPLLSDEVGAPIPEDWVNPAQLEEVQQWEPLFGPVMSLTWRYLRHLPVYRRGAWAVVSWVVGKTCTCASGFDGGPLLLQPGAPFSSSGECIRTDRGLQRAGQGALSGCDGHGQGLAR